MLTRMEKQETILKAGLESPKESDQSKNLGVDHRH